MVSIQDFRDAWADKGNRATVAFAIAEQYVAENAATLDPILGDKTSDELVGIVDLARAGGNQDMVTMVTMYELVKFERRQIGAAVSMLPKLPIPLRKKGGV